MNDQHSKNTSSADAEFEMAEFLSKEAKGQRARRHHYVPRFYLRNFTKSKKLRAYQRPTGSRMLMTVSKAAVETDLYTVTAKSGEITGAMEHVLSLFEDAAAPVIKKIVTGDFSISSLERSSLADFIAVQSLRTPAFKRQQEMIAEMMLDSASSLPWDRESIHSMMKRQGSELTDHEADELIEGLKTAKPDQWRVELPASDWLTTALSILPTVSSILQSRNWTFARARGDGFVTSDTPVVLWAEPEIASLGGLGFETATEIRVPLSPKILLCITREDYPEGYVSDVPKRIVKSVNKQTAASAYKWIFQHPDGPDISEIIPATDMELLRVLR